MRWLSASFLLLLNLSAFSQNWHWAVTHPTYGRSGAGNLADARNGNVIAVITVDSLLQVPNATLTRGNYLFWYDNQGSYLNARPFPYSFGRIHTDKSGNIFCIGTFFDSLNTQGTTIYLPGANAFIVKLDPAGNEVWLRTYAGTAYSYSYTFDERAGDTYFCGNTQLDSIRFHNVVLHAPQPKASRSYMGRILANGNTDWAGWADASYIYLNPILSPSGNIRILSHHTSAGWTILTVAPNGSTLSALSMSPTTYEEFRLLHEDPAGNFYFHFSSGPRYPRHHVQSTNAALQRRWDIQVATSYGCLNYWIFKFDDKNQQLHMGGQLYESFCGPDSAFGMKLYGSSDQVFARYDYNGNLISRFNIGGTAAEYYGDYLLADDGSVYVSGTINNPYPYPPAPADTVCFGSHCLLPDGSRGQMFVARLEGTHTGLNERSHQAEISLHPNPAVHVVSLIAPRAGHITISDVSGKVVLEMDVIKGENQIPIDNISQGLYFTRYISSHGNSAVAKLLIRQY